MTFGLLNEDSFYNIFMKNKKVLLSIMKENEKIQMQEGTNKEK